MTVNKSINKSFKERLCEPLEQITLEQAQSLLKKHIKIEEKSEEVKLENAVGRILTGHIYADIDQPPFHRSPLDGYALKASDVVGASQEEPCKLKVVGTLYAGDSHKVCLGKGQAVRIMTGAPIPDQCDLVIKQEDTDYGEQEVAIFKGQEAFKNFCFSGEDYKSGDILVEKGSILNSESIGIIGSTGHSTVRVRKKLKVGLLSTGAELVGPGGLLSHGQIYNSNLYALSARLIELGCDPVVLEHSGDCIQSTLEEIRLKFDGLDVMISTGGVSVGQRDIMHEVHSKLHAKRLFWKLKLKPGSPVLASIYKGKLFLSLSGNPMAAGVTFELMFTDLLNHWLGDQVSKVEKVNAVVDGQYLKVSKIRRFIKAKLVQNTVYLSSDKIASGNLKSTVGCNCLVEIPAGNTGVKSGDILRVFLYRRT